MFENKKIKLDTNQSLILNECDRLWMITSGEVDVFYASVDENGEYSSALKYLYSAKSGELLFSLITSENKLESYKLIAVGNEASLIAINKNKLLRIEHLFLISMIDKWVLKTAYQIQQNHSPRIYTALEASKIISLKKDTIAYPAKGVMWSLKVKGEYRYYSENNSLSSDSELNFPIAVSNSLWLKAIKDDTEIKILSTREVLKDEIDFMRSLNN